MVFFGRPMAPVVPGLSWPRHVVAVTGQAVSSTGFGGFPSFMLSLSYLRKAPGAPFMFCVYPN